MAPKKYWRVFLPASLGVTVVIGLMGAGFWRAWQSTRVYQFTEARRVWEARTFQHYRMAANYAVNWAQCYYDVEVQNDRIIYVFGLSCLSSAESMTLTIDGIFENFERFVTQRVCSSNGCYCEGTYVVRATYDPTWGYPQTITTVFIRDWLDDLVHGKYEVQECLRTTPVVERIDVVKVSPLP